MYYVPGVELQGRESVIIPRGSNILEKGIPGKGHSKHSDPEV